jgi:filamentous hemagglutinin family protein
MTHYSRQTIRIGHFRQTLLGCASLYALAAGIAPDPARAAAPSPLSPSWFQQRGTIGSTSAPSSTPSVSPVTSNGQGLSPQALQQVQQSIADVTQAAKVIAAAQAQQSRARAAVLATGGSVPNGLALGGLQPVAGAVAGSAAWQGANLPTQTAAAAHTTVTVKQTSPQAVLTWQSYNVGQNTTLAYDQSAGGALASTWVALNRVTNPNAQPSTILGSITAPGQVYVINSNGIIFGGASQVNVNALVASTANINTTQFLTTGIYSTQVGNVLQPSFTGASAASPVIVEAGATITTNTPTSAVQAGGFVLLLGGQVQNGGAISTPNGQVAMAAGGDFILQPGFSVANGSSGNSTSTTRGIELAVADSGGAVFNTGILQATTGDITMVGHSVTQGGVAVSTTSVAQRGTIHLLTDMTDATASVVLASGSLTLIQPDDAGATPALDSQRVTSIVDSAMANVNREQVVGLNDQASLPDQQYQSRIEITSGGLVDFKSGSLTAAPGGQVAVSTGTGASQQGGNDRILVETGAVIDVAGLLNVPLPMSANDVEVNIQGFELRDASVNRDTTLLNSSNVFVDVPQLVSVPASAADPTNRLYTAGGLLEVSGEVGNIGHSINEWSTLGGTVILSGSSVVTQPGSVVNIAGGSIAYQAGMLQMSYLVGVDGNIYNVNTAPADLQYTGLFTGFTTDHPRWNVSDTFNSPIVDPSETFQAAYTVGRDAGTLVVSAPTVSLEGTINAGVVAGASQTASRPAAFGGSTPVQNTPFLLVNTPSLFTALHPSASSVSPTLTQAAAADDPFQLAQNVIPLGGELLVGAYTAEGLAGPGPQTAAIANGTVPAAGVISANQVTASGLATLSIAAAKTITVQSPFTLAPGGQLSLTAADVAINGSISAPAGTVTVTNLITPTNGILTALANVNPLGPSPITASIILGTGASIDTSGLWTNALLDPANDSGEALINGGNVTLQSSGAVILATGSVIDTSSGAAILASGQTLSGSGGNITLMSDVFGTPGAGSLVLHGVLHGAGVTQGGTLTLQAPAIVIGTQLGLPVQGVLVLPAAFFQQGFSAYNLNGNGDVTDAAGVAVPGVLVTPGTDVAVTEPVYEFTNASFLAPTGTAPASALSLVLPPLYFPNPITAKLTPRAGASLVLSSAFGEAGVSPANGFTPAFTPGTGGGEGLAAAGGGTVVIGPNATLRVDPLQSILVQGYDEVRVDGTLVAPGGSISVLNDRVETGLTAPLYVPGQSVWIGGDATLDVAAQAFTALDTQGRPYGTVPNGGTITLGATAVGNGSTTASLISTDALVIIRPGAVLDASGTSAAIDPQAGTSADVGGVSAKASATVPRGAVPVASNGGTISLSSNDGIFIDGTLTAAAGGVGAAGGTLNITLETPVYQGPQAAPFSVIPDSLRVAHEVVIDQLTQPSLLPAGLAAGDATPFENDPALIGTARVSAEQITSGGFSNVSIFARDLLLFDGSVTLSANQSISLVSAEMADTSTLAHVTVAAPYLFLGNAGAPTLQTQLSVDASLTSGQQSVAQGAPFSLKFAPCLAHAAGACSDGVLSFQADLIDVEGAVGFGVESTITLNTPAAGGPAPTTMLDEPGFNDVNFTSSGDIRFLSTIGSTGTAVQTDITSAGNLSFTAAQLYPVTGASAAVFAGIDFSPSGVASFYPEATLTISGNGTSPAPPLSAAGSLAFSAPTIIQGGIVRAPAGTIELGQDNLAPANVTLNGSTTSVELLPGSITSVSGAGEVIPFGGTTDGINYTVDGQTVQIGNLVPAAAIAAGGNGGVIALSAEFIQVAAGATLDLSGGGVLSGGGGESTNSGGTLTSQGFISGRGGSTDTLYTPLVTFNAAAHSVSTPPVQTQSNPNGTAVYAIVPGLSAYAPTTPYDESSNYAGSVAKPGSQITIPAGVPGLNPGTYTLLPSYYALLPGGFRVELDTGAATLLSGTNALLNGSFQVNAITSVANTQIHSPLTVVTTLTSGAVLRTYSQYDEESYSSFVTAQAALASVTRPFLPQDAKTLLLNFTEPPQPSTPDFPVATAFTFNGTALFQPAAGGYGGSVAVEAPAATPIEITIAGNPTPGFAGVSVGAAQLDALGASRIVIGGQLSAAATVNTLDFSDLSNSSLPITVRDGAVLRAPEVMLVGDITLEPGAVIDTVGAGPAPFSPGTNVFYENAGIVSGGGIAVVAASNGNLQFFTPGPGSGGPILFGVCAQGDNCSSTDAARIDSEGSINFVTGGSLTVGNNVRYGSAAITFDVANVNIGSPAALATANVPQGLQLTQTTINTLLAGDPSAGAPPLQTLTLTASQAVNFYGTVSLDTINPATGQSTLGQVVLSTPAIYGFGASSDVATLATGTLVWSGLSVGNGSAASSPAPPVMTGGPGTGSGTLNISAQEIIFGYPAQAQAQDQVTLDRTILGFSNVNLTASSEITANNNSALSVHQAEGAYQNGTGFSFTGGNLAITTPLLTGSPGAVLAISAGSALTVQAPAGGPGAAIAGGLGAEIDLTGSSVALATTIALPGGKLAATATSGDVVIGSGAAIDLAGQAVQLLDQTVFSPGGTLQLTSALGNVTAAPGSTIDVSATGANAGSVTASAAAGSVALDGAILGAASAGFESGTFSAVTGSMSQAAFNALNSQLNAGGFFTARSFDIKTGNLVIGTDPATGQAQLRSNAITVSVDAGSLLVDGLVDASGPTPGTISLSANGNLTLTGAAVLDAHSTVLQVDGMGQPIDASNTATIALTTRAGVLQLMPGATLDLLAPDGVARGDVELNVPRTGNVGISASGPVSILGAATVALNAFQTYVPGQEGLLNGGLITQSDIDAIGADSTQFIAAALGLDGNPADTDLQGRIAGLAAYGAAFHLRPGVEIDSSAASGGNLTVSGDLDLSGLRYHSANPANDITSVYGSGEPGVLVLRAAGNLNVYGSITDGFGLPPATPDDNGWFLTTRPTVNFTVPSTLPTAVTLKGGNSITSTRFSNKGTLNFDVSLIPLASVPLTLVAGAVIPVVPAGSAPVTLAASGTIATSFVATGSIKTPTGLTFTAGQTVAAGTTLPAGTILGAGLSLPISASIAAVTWPAGVSLDAFAANVVLASNLVLQPGWVIPAGSTLTFTTAGNQPVRAATVVDDAAGDMVEGRIWAVAPLLPASDQSWSIQLVAGADLGAADTRTVQTAPALAGQATAANPAPGSIVLSDPHYMNSSSTADSTQAVESVIRTGTGSLTLLAGGNITEDSLFGIYTAGHQPADVTAAFNVPQANLPGSSSVLGSLGNSITLNGASYNSAIQGYQAYYPTDGGNVLVSAQGSIGGFFIAGQAATPIDTPDSNAIGNWLYRQGGDGVSTAYWVNFGTYVAAPGGADIYQAGFTGIGALGGGNVTVSAGGNAGVSQTNGMSGIDIAVASTGRVLANGSVEQTGGGTLTLQVGGALNAVVASGNFGSAPSVTPDQSGTLTDLRGTLVVNAGSIGSISLNYGANLPNAIPDPFVATEAQSVGGPVIVLGDATASLTTRGDLVLGGAGDPTRETQYNLADSFSMAGGAVQSWFSLWTPATGISLFSAGGNLAPVVEDNDPTIGNANATDFRFVYPPNFTAVAAQGSIYLNNLSSTASPTPLPSSLELAPAADGELKMLAGNSIFDSNVAVDISGANPQTTATLFNPAFVGPGNGSAPGVGNVVATGDDAPLSLFAFGPDTPTTNLHAGDANPALFYAATGDIIGLQTGETLTFISSLNQNPSFIAAKAVQIEAGQDIISLGDLPGTQNGTPETNVTSSGSLILNSAPNDVSLISAGRDITFANVQIAGPGNLLVQAGRNFFQGQQGVLESIGPLVDVNVLTRAGGAGITVLAGVGATGPNYTGFAQAYLDPANQADPSTPLQDQPGKVVQTYAGQLLSFLQTEEGYTGAADGALAFFQALPVAQRAIFLLPLYFDELNQSGLEFNDPTSLFFKSYLRGNDAIATLFPGTFAGAITLFGASGIRTDFGGNVSLVAPGGQIELGITSNAAPAPTAGILTQGSGDIDIYAQGSVELGQSRIFTTFGGNIVIWSSDGDIAAGDGAKSTVVFTPPNITYDDFGNITLSPTVPSTGAGIATLAPVASVPPGDINLVAPLGIIDAGEAGIRASGNANLAALTVVNAANIQVQGKTTGLPVIAVPNVSALTAAGNANGSAFQSALSDQAAARRAFQSQSTITVEVIGYGGDAPPDSSGDADQKKRNHQN